MILLLSILIRLFRVKIRLCYCFKRRKKRKGESSDFWGIGECDFGKGCTTIWLLKIVCSILIRHYEVKRRSNPHHEASLRGGTTKQSPCSTKLLIGFNQGIASSRHWDFGNSNTVWAGFAMTVNRAVIVGRCDDSISSTMRLCEKERRNNPYPRSVIARRNDEAIPMDYYTTFLI